MLPKTLLIAVLVGSTAAQCPGGKSYTDPSCKGVVTNERSGATIVKNVKDFVTAVKSNKNFAQGKRIYLSKLQSTAKYVEKEAGMAGLDAFILSALDGKGSFSRKGIESARREACQKATMNAMLSGLTIVRAKQAGANKNKGLWQQASSLYFGTSATFSSAPAATAEKRAKNYNTGATPVGMQLKKGQYGAKCDGCYNTRTHKITCGKCKLSPATQNQKIFDFFKKGPSKAGADGIMAQIVTTYMQASLRYLNKMDKDNAVNKGKGAGNKNQGEGWAFYKTIEGYVKSKSQADARMFDEMYNMKKINKATKNYCKGLQILLTMLPATYADLGTLNEDYSKYKVSYDCPGPDMQGLLADAAALKASVGSCTSRDMAAVKTVYTKGRHTTTQVMKAMGTLQKNVKAASRSTTYDKLLDKMIISAIDGTGSFKGAKSAGKAGCPARKEFIVKSIQNNLFSKLTIKFASSGASDGMYLKKGQHGAKCNGCYSTKTHKITCGACKPSPSHWARAKWIYSGPAQQNMSPYATANKRAKNYGTKDSKFGSVVNRKIMNAFAAKPKTSLVTAISGQIHITYMQATLRYLNKMDKSNTKNKGKGGGWKNQGEGWGFYMVIADHVLKQDKALNELLLNAYDLDQINTVSSR